MSHLIELSKIVSYDGIEYDMIIRGSGDNVMGRYVLSTVANAGLPPIQFITQRSYKQDGVSELAYYLEPRTIGLNFRAQDCSRDQFWALRHTLLEVTRPNRNGTYVTYYLTFPDGTMRAIRGRPRTPIFPDTDPEQWDEFAISEVIQIDCFDPVWFDPTQQSEESVTPPLVEKEYTFGIPFAYEDVTVPLNTVSSGNYRIAQLFYVYEACEIEQLTLWADAVGSPAGTCTVDIQGVTNNLPDGVSLLSTTFDESTLGASLDRVILPVPATAFAVGLYAVVISSDRADSDTDYIEFAAFYNSYLDSLVSYWQLDEDCGVRADSHKDNPLTEKNAVGQTVGIGGSGYAALFVSSNSTYLKLASNSDIQGGDKDFTYAIWVNANTLGSNRGILSKWGAAGAREYRIYYDNGIGKMVFVVSNNGTATTTLALTFAISINTDYFIVAWHDSVNNVIGLSVNGTSTTTPHTTGVYAGTVDLEFGRSQGALYLDGWEAKGAFWNGRVLSSGNRSTLYNSGAGRSYSELAGLGLDTNLVSWWNMDEEACTRYDSHGSNDLTDPQTVYAVTAKQIQGMTTPATTRYLIHADNADLSPTSSFSWSGWMRLSSVGVTASLITKSWGAAGTLSYRVRFITGTNRFVFEVSNDGTATTTVTANSFGAPGANTWYFVVIWFDDSNNLIGISVNDVSDTAAFAANVFDSASELRIGFLASAAVCDVDEVGFWNRVLSSTERTFLYAGGRGTHYYDIRGGWYFRQSFEKLTSLASWISNGNQLIHDFLVKVSSYEELTFPITFPIYFIGDANAYDLTVNYTGSWYSYPVLEVYGPTNGFSITHNELGKTIGYLQMVEDGEIVTLTLGENPTIISSVYGDKNGALSPISDLQAFRIEPDPIVSGGVNTLTVQAADIGDNTLFVLRYYVRYIGI